MSSAQKLRDIFHGIRLSGAGHELVESIANEMDSRSRFESEHIRQLAVMCGVLSEVDSVIDSYFDSLGPVLIAV